MSNYKALYAQMGLYARYLELEQEILAPLYLFK